jgi:hypothetical protein
MVCYFTNWVKKEIKKYLEKMIMKIIIVKNVCDITKSVSQ